MDKFVVIDLETTGHSPAVDDQIIEIGIVVIENNQISEEFTTLLKPKKIVPKFITNLTGIDNSDVENAPYFKDIAETVISFFEGAYFVAHNVTFDLGFLNHELNKSGFEPLKPKTIDTVELSRILFPQAPGFKLNQLAEFLQISHDHPHRALSDAYVTAKLLLILTDKLAALPYETITHLLTLEEDLQSDIAELLTYYQEKASMRHDDQYEVFQGIAYKKSKPINTELYEVKDSFGSCLEQIYDTNGALAREMQSYEQRPGQKMMSEQIYDCFQANQHALIEAETGTGKSLAYLIPAVYEAVKQNEKIVISTYTTQLQNQLLEEEIPLLKKIISFPFTATILKGKSHYISLERFAYALANDHEENYDLTLTKAMILVWLTETETGDVDEIQLPSSGYYFFRKISTEAERTLDPKSPWYSRSYYYRAQMRAEHADIIITNHALLCSDLFNDYRLLPDYQKVIVDEAHHFDETAGKYYGFKMDYASMQFALNQLGTSTQTSTINQLINQYPSLREEINVDQWDEQLKEAKYELDTLFGYLYHYVLKHRNDKTAYSDIGRIQHRLMDPKQEKDKQWISIQDMAKRLIAILNDLIHTLAKINQYLKQDKTPNTYDVDDVENHAKVLQTYTDYTENLFLQDTEPTVVKWIEIDVHGGKNAVFLYSEPADMSALLKEKFFNDKQSVILTSATLTMRNSFSFIRNKLGLTADDVVTEKIPSPFSYEDQVRFMVPNDFPHINDEDFIYATCEAILSLAEITKGRMLVLFTSYEMLRKSYFLLQEMMDVDEYILMAQGISSGSRTRLKKNFQTFEKAILLGTSSFWEGVDIKGEALSSLMIVRLPFQPPNHPVLEAKAESYKQQGKNAFYELSLPHAVLRFKQGFGRLIRSANDRGIVFVCDARIMKSSYGKFFLDSIPPVPVLYHSTNELMEQAESWF